MKTTAMKTMLKALLFVLVALHLEPAHAAGGGFTLDEYRAMEARSGGELEVILEAMYQTAVYAQAAIEHPAICFSPVPLAGSALRAMVAEELANPSLELGRTYSGDDPAALVLVNALRAGNVCR